MKLAVAGILVGVAAATLAAQNAETTLPQAYTLQLENEWVKVVRVRYEPHVKLPAHAHTQFASAYVYLSDAGPVVFRHVGAEYSEVTRPPVKAGTFRLFRAVGERHEVESLSDQTSDFLRVEFKTEPRDPRTLRGRYHREVPAPRETVVDVQFENAQIRATRLAIAPDRSIEVKTTAEVPALLVYLFPSPGHRAGEVQWLPVRHTDTITNRSNDALEMLRFDLLTAPIRSATP